MGFVTVYQGLSTKDLHTSQPTNKCRRNRGLWVCADSKSSGEWRQPFETRNGRNRLREIPVISKPEEHLSRALRVSSRASLDAVTKRGKSFNELLRLSSLKKLDTFRQELANRLEKYLREFPRKSKLHPYEDALVDLTLESIGLNKYGGYNGVLEEILDLKKKINIQGKDLSNGIRNAENKKGLEKAFEDAFTSLENIYRKNWGSVERLKLMAIALHRLQIADVDVPTIIIAGAPNVGKSSLVRVYSSGIPEVCAYPFTTKTIIMGHFTESGRTFQMTDTPGLLNRDEDDRNTIEKLAVAALQHLNSVVLFIVDLTEDCGTSVADQLELRTAIRERFPRADRQWIDVLSKSDLDEFFKHESLYLENATDPIQVSVETGQNLEPLKDRFIKATTEAAENQQATIPKP
ncbi:hypothetical protein NDN08_002284 [Rhodosorus marinus]|uniref:OBG-type G domain-containing protein n=1 Tax=Rhodosorus marinus TaxID=101924 RepID=A0AAV8UTA5_9RHOD|nr:hypothetical protein NDN08_002284 [Rhodosorus marinus]